MKIRKATIKDLGEIAKLFLEYGELEHKLDKNVRKESLKDILKIEKEHMKLGTEYFIVEENDNLLGVINTNIDKRGKEKIGVFHTIIITKEARGKGYGKKLLKHVSNYFKKKGCLRVRTFIHKANKNALNFWIKQGFQTEEGYHASKRLT